MPGTYFDRRWLEEGSAVAVVAKADAYDGRFTITDGQGNSVTLDFDFSTPVQAAVAKQKAIQLKRAVESFLGHIDSAGIAAPKS